jgi:hypothetical protein
MRMHVGIRRSQASSLVAASHNKVGARAWESGEWPAPANRRVSTINLNDSHSQRHQWHITLPRATDRVRRPCRPQRRSAPAQSRDRPARFKPQLDRGRPINGEPQAFQGTRQAEYPVPAPDRDPPPAFSFANGSSPFSRRQGKACRVSGEPAASHLERSYFSSSWSICVIVVRMGRATQERPLAIKYNYIGIPTTCKFDGEIPLPHLKVTVSDHQDNPIGIQRQRYRDGAPAELMQVDRLLSKDS